MKRNEVRYLLYRIRTREETGRSVEIPPGFEEVFYGQEDFTSWIDFARRWDVAETDQWKVVPLNRTEEERWDRYLESIAIPLE
jgi:hypothetical protein